MPKTHPQQFCHDMGQAGSDLAGPNQWPSASNHDAGEVEPLEAVAEVLAPFADEIRSIDVEGQAFNFDASHWLESIGPDSELQAAVARFRSRVSRGDLFSLSRECAANAPDISLLRQTFFGVMLWGYGRRPRFGPGRVGRIIAAPTFGEALMASQRSLARGALVDAYKRLMLPELGPPFLSKVLYFLGVPYRTNHPVPVIIDQFVAATLEWLLGAGQYFKWTGQSLSHSPERYLRYVSAIHRWSEALNCEVDQIEMFLWKEREGGQLWTEALGED
jgi:hypothetical protein